MKTIFKTGLVAALATIVAVACPESVQAKDAGTAAAATGDTADKTGDTSASASDSRWEAQTAYWREKYPSRPYYNSTRGYEVYEPAYRYGVELYNLNRGRNYGALKQAQLRNGWAQARGDSVLSWNEAQMATRDAYNRLYENHAKPRGNTR